METARHKTVNRPAAVQPAAASRGARSAEREPGRRVFTYEIGGKRMYLSRSGKMIELPSDMTGEEAARLEAEAEEAQKKLGQGPPPRPVPDVKKLAKKEAKKEKPKPKAKGKFGDKGKGRAAPKAAAVAASLLKGVGPGKVAQYLAAKGAPALTRGVGQLQRLKQNEQTHDDASDKLEQSEKAVVVPESEGQSKSNTGQVDRIGGRPAPVVDENKGKQTLQESLQENVPRNIEDVDNFKRHKKAQHMGADVMKVVQEDKNAVTATFGEIEKTPPPTPPEREPEALPPEEPAPPTPVMNLGQGAVAPLQKEHTDLSNFTKEADGKLKEEGVTQEQLDMVDSGELAEANKEKKGMEKTAKTEPLAVETFAKLEAAKVDQSLKQDEKKERDTLRAKRKAGLGATSKKQKGTKSALEKKREEVAAKINGIYQAAQEKVKKKLADLETRSMKRFDEGNARATQAFEENVKSELDAYKADRYSGWFGWARKAKDWLLGMDELPAVKAIFERNRAAFVNTINTLVEEITADSKKTIQECKEELDNAKKKIKEYVDGLEPSLKGIGKKAAAEMNERLNELDGFISQKEEELQGKLKDKQKGAIKAIDDKITKMKEAMSGALAKLGRLLLYAAKKFFTWALGKFGYSLGTIESIIDKGIAVLKAIFTGPIQFVKRLIDAAGSGFKSFGKNFLTHLKNAVFEWLTGSLEGIVLPESWNLKGILSVVFQIVGITYQNIRAHLVRLVPEPVVKTMETSFSLVKTLITEGPMAAWEQLKEIAGDLKEAFVEAVKNWIKWKVVEEAIKTVLAIFIPGAGIVRAIIAIYDTIVFFIQKAKQIMQMIGNFLGSIGEIAAGNIGAAAAALEEGLARGLKLVIAFLAKFLRLEGITKKIREVLHNIKAKVDDVIGKVAKWIVEKGKALWGGVKTGVKGLIDWAWSRKNFRGEDGKTHQVYILDREGRPKLIMESTPAAIETYLAATATTVGGMSDQKQKAHFEKLIETARGINALIARDTEALATTQEKGRQVNLQKSIQVNTDRITPVLSKLTAANAPALNLPAVLPPMTNGVKARGFMAEYLKIGNFRHGTEASEYSGRTLGGWKALQAAGMTGTGTGQYIKMHLLPSRLGGDAVDSNLTPALSSINLTFSRNVEMPAWRGAHTDYIWYQSAISYHGGTYPHNTFPSRIASEWGYYDKMKQPWTKLQGKTAEHRYADSPPAPVLPVMIDMNQADEKGIADFFNISVEIARQIVRLRKKSPFASATDVIMALQGWYANPSRVRPPNWEDHVDKVAKQLISKGTQILY